MQDDYEQKINQCIRLQQKNNHEYARLLARLERLSVGGDSSQPRAGVQGSSSSSTMGQVIVHSSYKFAGIRLGLSMELD
jgi:hypothetical protein